MPTPLEAIQNYFNANPSDDDQALRNAPAAMWQAKGQEQALKVFHLAAERVPAYKDFLRKQKIDHQTITSVEAFRGVPLTDKESYLLRYPLDQLCLDGKLPQTDFISSSSGSTGRPFYWPRMLEQDVNVAKVLELLFRAQFAIDRVSTLMVMSFGLGVWTAGTYMLTSSRLVAAKGYPMTITSPGIDLEESVNVIKYVAPHYDQVILVGFPAFVKDVVERVIADGVQLKGLHLKVFTAGEVHTEPWRDYLIQQAGMANEYCDITSVLASSEGGLIGMETALSVYVRRACYRDQALHRAFFGEDTLPSIVQYNPMSRFYEVVSNDLVLTSAGALPLVRFNTKDRGGVMGLDEVMSTLAKTGISAEDVVQAIGARPWSLPCVFVFGRSDLSVTIYAVNVYPESIKAILLAPELQGKITGRFAMRTSEDEKRDQFLEFFVELSPGRQAEAGEEQGLARVIADHLRTVNSEFRKLSESVTRPNLVQVRLRKFQDREYFSSNKQKFVITNPHAGTAV